MNSNHGLRRLHRLTSAERRLVSIREIRESLSRPDWNEVIPLVQMLADTWLKGTHDLLCESLTRGRVAQFSTIIFDGGKKFRSVAIRTAWHAAGQQHTPRGARQFCRSERRM